MSIAPCGLCGAERTPLRAAFICSGCSAVTRLEQGDLFAGITFAPNVPVLTVADDPRLMELDEVVHVAMTRGAVLDEAARCVMLLMLGADVVRANREGRTLSIAGMCVAEPRRKTLAQAVSLAHAPLRPARIQLRCWERGSDDGAEAFEKWLAEGDGPVRREAALALDLSLSGLDALRCLTELVKGGQDAEDSWHADPYVRGLRAGKRLAYGQVEALAARCFHHLASRAKA
jgi:hypothetical protein